MGPFRGRHRRKLVDMGEYPQEQVYEPPPVEECDEADESPYEMTPADTLHVLYRKRRGKVVHFVLTQATYHHGDWHNVARIDTWHGTIHRHQLDRNGDDVGEPEVLVRIPAGEEGWPVVDQGYTDAWGLMFNEWEDNLRRWRDGR